MLLYIIIGIVVLLLIVFFIMLNGFIRANNRVKEAFATMDVYLKKRWDLIPNLVETVKGYTKHEQETLEEVIKMRLEKGANEIKAAKFYDYVITNDRVPSAGRKIMEILKQKIK